MLTLRNAKNREVATAQGETLSKLGQNEAVIVLDRDCQLVLVIGRG